MVEQIEIVGEILQVMKDLVEFADDVCWVSPGETVFERLWNLYVMAGGSEGDLVTAFPEYAA